jgi:hypothetical protein
MYKKKEKRKISIFDENNNVMNSHSHKLERNRCCNNKLDRVITLKLEHMWRCKEYDDERNKAKHNFHSLEYFLSQKRNLDVILKLRIEFKVCRHITQYVSPCKMLP